MLVLVAAGFLVWAGTGWLSAGADVDRARQDLAAAKARLTGPGDAGAVATKNARDEARKAGQDAVVVMNTVDYRDADAALGRWAEVTTGSLHDEVVSSHDQSVQAIENAKSVTKAKAIVAAVQAVDDRAGTATVLVALQVDVELGGAAPTTKYLRIRGTLRHTDQGWKLDGLGQVPVGQ